MNETAKRSAIALGSLALVSGCALPLPIVIAGYAADGVSLMASEKTLSDHALSAVADEDCALWRIVTDEDICVDNGRPIDIMVASADGPVVYGAPTRPVERAAVHEAAVHEDEPAREASANAVAVLPAGAPAAAIAALATTRGYDEIRNAHGIVPLPAGTDVATVPAASPPSDNQAFVPVAQLGFDVPFPPGRPTFRLVADGGSHDRYVSQRPDAVSDVPLPPTVPARRGTVATVPDTVPFAPLPARVPAERG